MTLLRAFLALWLAVPALAAPAARVPVVPVRAGLAPVAAAPAWSARASFELQKDSDRLYASLASIHARAKAGEKAASLVDAKRAFLDDLSAVVAQLPPAPAAWPALSARLKEARAERAALEKDGKADARLESEIVGLQLRAALSQIKGEAPLNSAELRRNAAMWSLVGAYNSAASGNAQSAWAEGRGRAEVLFGDGTAVVVSSRWRNAHAELEDAARDARNGRQALAAEKLSALAWLLRRVPADAENLARNAKAADALEAAAKAGDGARMSELALAAKSLIKHPKLPDPVAVPYAGLGKAARAQVHALESVKKDYLSVLEREAALSKWSEVLAGPRPTKRNIKNARGVLADVQAWAARGFVGGKQVAAQALSAALEALEVGDNALAARHAAWAKQELAMRRAELERIGSALLRRLGRLAGV